MGAGAGQCMLTNTIIVLFFFSVSNARMFFFCSGCFYNYSCEKWRKNSLAQFANSSFYSIIPLSCILWGKPRFGLSIMLLIIDGPDFLVMILSPTHDDFINP